MGSGVATGEVPRLHKPGVAGSSPAAATSQTSRPSQAVIDHAPAEEYHSRPEVSCSQLKELDSSPLGFYLRYEAKSAPPKTSDSLYFGTLLHRWAELGEEEFWKRASVCPAEHLTETGKFGKAARQWMESVPDISLALTPADATKLRAQTSQMLLDDAARECFETAIDKEFNVTWDWHGHRMRSRIDGATPGYWYDIKTTRAVDPLASAWGAVKEWRYDMQAAIYEAAAEAAGWPPHRLRFIFTSTVWPHACAVVTLPEPVVRRGRRRALELLAELKQRREWGSWLPANYGKVHELSCPRYMHDTMRGEE